LRLASQRQQRIKFDITQHELLVDPPENRAVFHRYADIPGDAFGVACYSVNEILAEKTRALYERQGRARDVYDVVHISRSFTSSH
jgi:predicted nucleotidyltransferase component of viral defense system